MKKLLIFILLFFQINQAFAKSKLEQVFDKMGSSYKATNAGAYNSQAGGYWSGGGVKVRNKQRDVNLVNIKMPSQRTGCGGIDIFKGGFNMISGSQLKEVGKSAMGSAVSYGFLLTFQTVAPTIHNTMMTIGNWVRELNKVNINSCRAGQQLAQGVANVVAGVKENVCSAVRPSEGDSSSWGVANKACGSASTEEQKETFDKIRKGDSAFKDLMIDEYNLVWKILQKNPFFEEDVELSEFVMSLTGTIVSNYVKSGDDSETQNQKKYYSSLLDAKLLDALMYGSANSDAKIYQCVNEQGDSNECLNVEFQQLNEKPSISKILDLGVVNYVEKVLKDIAVKAVDDTTQLNDEEKALINSSQIPLMKLISVEAAYKKGAHVGSILQYSEIIAYDMILQMLSEMLLDVTHQLASAKAIVTDKDDVKEIRNSIYKVRSMLKDNARQNISELESKMKIIEEGRYFERANVNKAGQAFR